MFPSLNIACATDHRYAPYCAAMLHSLFVHNAHVSVAVHYLHPPDFSNTLKENFRQLAARHGAVIRFHQIPDQSVEGLPTTDGFQRVIWYRIFLSELLPELDRVLYLDADTLITDRLDVLWRTDFDGCHVAAVRNVIEPRLESHTRNLGLPDKTAYFNSGVLLMNLVAWRRDDSATRILGSSRVDGCRLLWPDQDALNVAFASSCKLLHPRWNCQNSLYFWRPWANKIFGEATVESAIGHPAVLHFEGPARMKPWHFLCRHPYRAQYWRHLRATGFPLPVTEGVTLSNILRKCAAMAGGPFRALVRLWRPREAHS